MGFIDQEKFKIFVVDALQKDQAADFSRGVSWEHCYVFFQRNRKELQDAKNDDLNDRAALHLGFYLASWGMFRNSFLLQVDYNFYKSLVTILTNTSYEKLWNPNYSQRIGEVEYRKEVLMALRGLYNALSEEISRKVDKLIDDDVVKDKKKGSGASRTLLTKIMMGTIGCVPAFDGYFSIGLKGSEKFEKLGGFENNMEQFMERFWDACDEINDTIYLKEDSALTFPPMKLLDLYFWQLGFSKEKSKRD